MSAFGTFPCYAPPRGLLTPWGVAPHPTFATWQGCRENLLHPYHGALGRLQPVKAKPQAVASQALTGFQLRLLRIVLLPHGGGGVKGGVAVHFTLDALESTQHSP